MMTVLEIEYQGDDLIISKEVAEQRLGLHRGDWLEIRLKNTLIPIERSPNEYLKIENDLETLRQSINPDDLTDWETARKALWAT